MYKYHSIEQFRNVIKDIGFAFKDSMPILEFQGTVKIHGTNAGVVLPENYAQSRNNVITIENDNAGFARFHNEKSFVFLDFYSQVNTDLPIVIYGEWAGKGIQCGVGISEIERSFFIFGVKVITGDDTHYWLKDYPKLSSPENNIYDIRDFQTYSISVDFSNPQLSQNELCKITEFVEDCCPVAKAFGVNGVGEGVVWSHITDNGNMFSFKVKGEKHSSSKVKVLAEVDTEKMNSISDFVAYSVTESRLNQAWNELFEQTNVEPDIKLIGSFIKWVSQDISKEEADVLTDNNLTMKDVGGILSKKAKQWFISKI